VSGFHLYLSIYLSIYYLAIYLSIHLSIYLSIYRSLHISYPLSKRRYWSVALSPCELDPISIYLSTNLSIRIHPSIDRAINPLTNQPTYISRRLYCSAALSTRVDSISYLSIYLSIKRSIDRSIYLSMNN